MSAKNKAFIIIGAIILIPIIGFMVIASPWIFLAIGLWLSPAPPKPEIEYGEFDFKLVYQINGEIRTVQDTVVCEFDGYNIDEGRGKTRRWEDYLKNEQNNELYAFRVERPDEYKNSEPNYDQIVLENIGGYKVVLHTENAYYLMGDSENETSDKHEPRVQVYDKSIGYYKDPEQSEEFLKGYNFKIISWEYDKPIENSFK